MYRVIMKTEYIYDYYYIQRKTWYGWKTLKRLSCNWTSEEQLTKEFEKIKRLESLS